MDIIFIFSDFDTAIITQKDKSHISYRHSFPDGEGVSSVYPVFPGVEVVRFEFQASRYVPVINKQMNILEINHCLKGRIECRMHDECLRYIGEGDLFLNTLRNHSESIELPLRYYHGMAVMIDLDVADTGIAGFLGGIPVNIRELAKRFFTDDECFLIESKDEIKHIFSGMYTVAAPARSIYYRIKILELLIYLYYFEPSKKQHKSVYARQQVEIIKQIQNQITGRIGHRFTIEELAHQYCISPTALKTYFKGVYGKSIAAYMKEYRIRKAASLLCETDQSIADVALSVGYESQSKFGAAFKEIMEITPLDYRRKFAYKSFSQGIL